MAGPRHGGNNRGPEEDGPGMSFDLRKLWEGKRQSRLVRIQLGATSLHFSLVASNHQLSDSLNSVPESETKRPTPIRTPS